MKSAQRKSNLIITTSDTTAKTSLHGNLDQILALEPVAVLYPFFYKFYAMSHAYLDETLFGNNGVV